MHCGGGLRGSIYLLYERAIALILALSLGRRDRKRKFMNSRQRSQISMKLNASMRTARRTK